MNHKFHWFLSNYVLDMYILFFILSTLAHTFLIISYDNISVINNQPGAHNITYHMRDQRWQCAQNERWINKLSGKSIRCSAISCFADIKINMWSHILLFSLPWSAVKYSSRQETGMDWKVNVENNLTTIRLAPTNPNSYFYCYLSSESCRVLCEQRWMKWNACHRCYQLNLLNSLNKTRWSLKISNFMLLTGQSDAHWHFHLSPIFHKEENKLFGDIYMEMKYIFTFDIWR